MTHPIHDRLTELAPTFVLATQLTRAHDVPLEDLDRRWYDRWKDEGEDWLIVLNGTSSPWVTKATPENTDYFETPFVLTVPAGCAFVMVDDEAVAVIHPTHNELFTAPDATRSWERALIHALRNRLVDLGEDLPPLADLVDEHDTNLAPA